MIFFCNLIVWLLSISFINDSGCHNIKRLDARRFGVCKGIETRGSIAPLAPRFTNGDTNIQTKKPLRKPDGLP